MEPRHNDDFSTHRDGEFALKVTSSIHIVYEYPLGEGVGNGKVIDYFGAAEVPTWYLLRRYQAGKEVQVYQDPTHPSRTVLSRFSPARFLVSALAGVVFGYLGFMLSAIS